FTFTASPVRGLRAVRAARSRFSKTPKPAMDTFSPLVTAFWISLRTASSAAAADFRSPRRPDIASISSALFTYFLLLRSATVLQYQRFCASRSASIVDTQRWATQISLEWKQTDSFAPPGAPKHPAQPRNLARRRPKPVATEGISARPSASIH